MRLFRGAWNVASILALLSLAGAMKAAAEADSSPRGVASHGNFAAVAGSVGFATARNGTGPAARAAADADHPAKRTNSNPSNDKTPNELWRSRSTVVEFENIEGIILLPATLRGTDGKDTTGTLALDTGAGHVALDARLAEVIGIDTPQNAGGGIGLADRPLPRLEVGGMQFDQISPVLTIDANIVRQVTDRPVLGLLGASPISSHAVIVDYRRHEVGFMPVPDSTGARARARMESRRSGPGAPSPAPAAGESRNDRIARIARSRAALGDAVHGAARPIAFRLRGDDKILVSARVANPGPAALSDSLTLIVDTGATKTALFASALAELAPRYDAWQTLRGLTAPTLVGSADARIARVPRIDIMRDSAAVSATHVDVAIIDSPLAAALSEDVGEPVHGLLGYSFLRRFRVVIDYASEVLWLESVPHTYDERLYEYTHVGLQLERRGTALSVVGIATGSPAAIAGIERGDEVMAIDGTAAAKLDVLEASRRLEGRAGTPVVLRVRRGETERTIPLKRRRLL